MSQHRKPNDMQQITNLFNSSKNLPAQRTLLGKKLAQHNGGDYATKESQSEMNQLRNRMNKVIKDNKIAMPITRAGIKQMCKALNLHCTETTAFEAIIACRGKHMDDSPPEEFNFDRLVQYLQFKSKFMPPADNPRQALSQARNTRSKNLNMEHSLGNAQTKLPPLRSNYNTQRNALRSQQSQDSQDQRITQAFRTKRNMNSSYDSKMGNDYHDSRLEMHEEAKYTPAQTKKRLERDPDFQDEMRNALYHLEKMPGLRAKVYNQVGTMAQQWNDQKGQEGMEAGEKTRMNLVRKKKEMEKAQTEGLDEMIKQTAQKSALQAINLSQLLKKKWTEERNAYVIMTKIKSDRQVRRLNDLCFNRYNM